MTTTLVSARAERSGHTRKIVAGVFALMMLVPFGAFGMDRASRRPADQAGNLLPLRPIPYLHSMRWMSWKPSAPPSKVDTLLLPDSPKSGFFRLPSDYERDLLRLS